MTPAAPARDDAKNFLFARETSRGENTTAAPKHVHIPAPMVSPKAKAPSCIGMPFVILFLGKTRRIQQYKMMCQLVTAESHVSAFATCKVFKGSSKPAD